MNNVQSLRHTVWECKYHVIWIPKYRRKALYRELRRHLGEVIRDLARQRESRVEEGHLRVDHVHMLISIPPKYAVSQVVGYIKGKSAIHIVRNDLGRRFEFHGAAFLGTRLLVFDSGQGCGPKIHPGSGERGSPARSVEHFQIEATFRWRQGFQPL